MTNLKPETRNLKRGVNAGFSMIETVVASFLATIFILVLVSLEGTIRSSQDSLNLNTQSYNEASISVQAITRELRNARPAATGAYPLELADDNEIVFYANIDDDPLPERVRYYVTGDQLNRGVVQPEGTPPSYDLNTEGVNLVIPYIANGANPIFTYYNGDWPADVDNNPLPAPTRLTDTKLVEVRVVINPQPERPESAYELVSSAQIRNLKTNL